MLERDLDAAVDAAGSAWRELAGARLLLTGATGFFGAWLLRSLERANARHRLEVEAIALTRDPARVRRVLPEVAGLPWLRLHRGDVRDFEAPPGPFTHVVHGAADASPHLHEADPAATLATHVAGTERVLAAAERAGAVRLLLVSSGAVYGRQPPEVERLDESFADGEPRSAYARGKREAERLTREWAERTGIVAPVARCFAFVGPYLPLDASYAAASFVTDALAGRPIRVAGDGRARRSYLYGSDLAAWLWTILLRGRGGRTYNVGSEREVSIADLAAVVAAASGGREVEIAGDADPGAPPDRYVPSTERTRTELGVAETVELRTAIERTLAWHRARKR